MRITLVGILVFLLFFSGSSSFTVEGYKPVYAPASEAKQIKALEVRDVETQGKIYIKDHYIYIGDLNKGVHVVDNTDPRNPQKILFIQIYGNHDIAIKGNVMYADNMEDLVAIDISDIYNPVEINRIEDVYELPNQNYPEDVSWGTYFVCADPDKGYVVGWVPDLITDPECMTTY
jgi:hypothetical protein